MHNLLQECSITFNDLVEARFDSYFFDFCAAFTIPAGKRNGYNNMIGNFEELTNPRAIGANGNSLPTAVLNLPLPFSHFRETGLSLPAAALPYCRAQQAIACRDEWSLCGANDVNHSAFSAPMTYAC
jgi:hypothetical protein